MRRTNINTTGDEARAHQHAWCSLYREGRFRIGMVLVLLAMTLAGLYATYRWPKSYIPPNNTFLEISYRGLDVAEGIGFLGRDYYLIKVDCGASGITLVQYSKPGFNDFTSFYPNGRVSATGQCFVEVFGEPAYPFPIDSEIRSARYYAPSGTLASTVDEHGNGVIAVFTPVPGADDDYNVKRITVSARSRGKWAEKGDAAH